MATRSTVYYGVTKRLGHVAVLYKHFLFVWGGFIGHKDDPDEYCPTNLIWIYNTNTEVWSVAETEGDLPQTNSGSTGLVFNDHLYIFGGVHSRELYRMDLRRYVWERLTPSGELPHPCDKATGWIYKDKLYFFGGYGPMPVRGSDWRQSQVVRDPDSPGRSCGWNNQLISYSPHANAWEWPQTKGSAPAPRAAHSSALAPDHRHLYLFGGRLLHVRNNQLYRLDMTTLTWSHDLSLACEGSVPEGVSWHSLNFISDTTAILYGGLTTLGHPSSKCWKLEVRKDGGVSWTRQKLLEIGLVWHKAVFAPQTGELIITGGITQSPYAVLTLDPVKHCSMTILEFQPLTLLRLCLRVLVSVGLVKGGALESQLPSHLANILRQRALS